MFSRISVVRLCTVIACVARVARQGPVVVDNMTILRSVVSVRAGKRALALLGKGWSRSLVRAVLFVLSCSTYHVGCVYYARYYYITFH